MYIFPDNLDLLAFTNRNGGSSADKNYFVTDAHRIVDSCLFSEIQLPKIRLFISPNRYQELILSLLIAMVSNRRLRHNAHGMVDHYPSYMSYTLFKTEKNAKFHFLSKPEAIKSHGLWPLKHFFYFPFWEKAVHLVNLTF